MFNPGETIRVESDNASAVTYLNKGGGTRSKVLTQLASVILDLVYKRNLSLIVSFVPGVDNIDADFESRHLKEKDEWSLHSDCAHFVFEKMGWPVWDLFASRHNAKTEKYISWFADPGSSLIDAFSHSWRGMIAYAFCPFNLVMKVVKKALSEEVESIIIVAPIWKAQPFYLELNKCAQHFLVIPYPITGHLLSNAKNDPHPCRSLSLGAWKIYGSYGVNSEFQR
jgi:hypothetical protein